MAETADLNDDVKIAGQFTVGDWKCRKESLVPGKYPEKWQSAYKDFFLERLRTRYFNPIQQIIAADEEKGEGFAIVALQCSLIEFLASTKIGVNYKNSCVSHGDFEVDSYYRKDPYDNDSDGQSVKQKGNEYEYCNSNRLFVGFLHNEWPFSEYITSRRQAGKFYEYVRCPLLHEARTKEGWTILAEPAHGEVSSAINVNEEIVYRNNLHCDFNKFIDRYAQELPNSKKLQEAFLRKINGLCRK